MANEKIVNRENLKAFRKAFQEKLENGQIIPALSKNLDAVSEESGITQETPFILQGTGTANGTASVDTSPIGKQLEKQGNSVVKNNQVKNPNFESGQGGIANYSVTISMDNNVLSVLYTSSSGYFGIGNLNIVSGHKYLFKLRCIEKNSSSTRIAIYNAGTLVNYSWKSYSLGENMFIYTANFTSANGQFFLYGENGKTDKFKYFDYVDLTQWFGSNDLIPPDLLDNLENVGRYGLLGVAYNTGTLENSTGRYLECGYRNLYDGENPIKAIPNATYNIYGSATLTYKDLSGNTISSEIKTNTTFLAPSNCDTIEVSGSGNITISLYYPTGEGYDKYYPYVEPKVYDTGTEILRSAGSVKDYKTPDGTIHRLVGNRAYQSGDENDSSLLTDGTTTNYPLETPTTEQGTPFVKEIEIDDYGTMGWKDTNNAYVDIPQGCKIFYPANVADFIDSIGQREDIGWDASEIASKTNLSEYVKQDNVSNNITKNPSALVNNTAPKIIKTGNIVNIFISAYCSSGAGISAGTVLYTLDSSTKPTANTFIPVVLGNANSRTVEYIRIDKDTGAITCSSNIAYDNTIHVSGTYII